MNIGAGAEIHDRISTPAARPDSLFNLFINGRAKRRVADIGVYLDAEVAADNHWFQLRMVDVGWNDGTSLGNLFPDKFRCYWLNLDLAS